VKVLPIWWGAIELSGDGTTLAGRERADYRWTAVAWRVLRRYYFQGYSVLTSLLILPLRSCQWTLVEDWLPPKQRPCQSSAPAHTRAHKLSSVRIHTIEKHIVQVALAVIKRRHTPIRPHRASGKR